MTLIAHSIQNALTDGIPEEQIVADIISEALGNPALMLEMLTKDIIELLNK